MLNLRMMIAAWIVENECNGPWLTRLFIHMTDQGVEPEVAIKAMTGFVDDAIRTTRQTFQPAPASPPGGAPI